VSVGGRPAADYMSRYSVKAAASTGTLDRPVVGWSCKGTGHESDKGGSCRPLTADPPATTTCTAGSNPHAQAMISGYWNPGAHTDFEQLPVQPWTPMLGFKRASIPRSRRYSTTLTALRRGRRNWRGRQLLAALSHSIVDTRSFAATTRAATRTRTRRSQRSDIGSTTARQLAQDRVPPYRPDEGPCDAGSSEIDPCPTRRTR
jgi:hypothetical protein